MTTGSSGGGGDGPTGGENLGYRVGALEQSFAKLDGKLDIILDRLGATDARLASIEAKLEGRIASAEAKLEGRIASAETKLEGRIALVDSKLELKASAIELAEVKGRVMSLPTTYQMITLVFGILGGAFLIIKFGLPHGP